MKIGAAGTVTISATGPVTIEGFVFDPETEDERKADHSTQMSMMAEAATKWAITRLQAEVERAQAEVIRKAMKGRQAS